MTEREQIIADFQTSMRLLIDDYKSKKQELADLNEELAIQKKKCEQLQAMLSAVEHDYQSLKMAKMLEISNGDIEGARQRVAKLIRDVNKCITLVNNTTNQ